MTARINTLYSLLTANPPLITFEEFMELAGSDSNIPIEKLKAMREEAENQRMLQQAEVMEQQAMDIQNEVAGETLGGMMSEAEANGMFAGMMGG